MAMKAPMRSVNVAYAFGREGAASQFHDLDLRKDDVYLAGSVTEVAEPASARADCCSNI